MKMQCGPQYCSNVAYNITMSTENSLLNPSNRARTKGALVAKLAEHGLTWDCTPEQAAKAFAPCVAPLACERQFRLIHEIEAGTLEVAA